MQPLQIRLLFESDIPSAMKLKEAAGWNQTEADWQRLLSLEPEGCFAAVEQDRLVGTTTTTTYDDDLAWIGMVLVEPASRRQGIASQLMKTALEYLNGKVKYVKLDATPDGKLVYEKFGFRVESLIERWSGLASPKLGTSSVEESSRELHCSLYELDLLAFGANRSELVRTLIEKASAPPVINCGADGSVSGYALVRPGTKADYIGPIVTTDSSQIESLLDRALHRLNSARAVIDWNKECAVSTAVLSDRGFVKERDLLRMTTGLASKKTSPFVFAIAGPEIG
jgi:ribosomal protein S18 acetylase RimI-like enzyme